ncbi:MAG: 2-oxoacid:acceptor oxidoreductase family protein, partial [Selenomonadaceae bacterium]|nr:2-oxoacid:acceptor oxidoreductase family protein [Selenomonadaceae bacterium]
EEVLQYLKEKTANLILIDSKAAARTLGSAKVLNMLLLGAAIRTGELGFEAEDIREAMREKVPAKFHDLNEKALMYTKEKGIS